jgi:hypothetical protein
MPKKAHLQLLPLAAIMLLATAILISCGPGPEPEPVAPTRRPGSGSSVTEKSGGFGSQVDPSQKPTFGTAVVTEDTYLGVRQTDRLSIIRGTLSTSPEASEVETFEDRLSKGKTIMRIKKGTVVTLRDIVPVKTLDGNEYRFRKVEIADGSLLDEYGDPVRGSVLDQYLRPR